MSTAEILWFERLSDHPIAAQLAVRGWLELSEKGFTDGMRDVSFHSGMACALAIVVDGKQNIPGGVIVYTVDEGLRRIWLDLSYVQPEFRGRGVYNVMWTAMVDRARGTGALSIESAMHVRNSGMRSIAKKQGREERFVMSRYVVPA